MAEFNLKELVAKAFFDYVGPPFPIWFLKNKKKFKLPGLKLISALKLGQPYFMTLQLTHKESVFEFPNEPLIAISLTKTIVETATVGSNRKGTVKEYINTEDYVLNIRGLCINFDDPDEYPAEQVSALVEMFDINEALEVKDNLYLEQFGIRKLVLKGIQFDEMVGEGGMQKYSITAVSDQDFYADLNEKNKEKSNLLA